MALLEVRDLRVEIDGKEILKGLDLDVEAGQVHAIMGPNGSGKSTLAYVLAGKEEYRPTAGSVRFDGRDLFEMAPDERAAAGLFLAFQYPLEIPGVATMTFLRTALNAQRKKRGQAELSTPDFIKKVRDTSSKLGIDQEMLGLARHARGRVGVDHVGHAIEIREPEARGEIDARLPFRGGNRGADRLQLEGGEVAHGSSSDGHPPI